MDKKLGAKILTILSMLFGLTVAFVAVMGDALVGPVAMVGGGILAVLWVANSLFSRPGKSVADS